MGLSLSRSNPLNEQVEQLLDTNTASVARLQALEVTVNQLRNEVNTLRAGKRKLEEQFEEFAQSRAAEVQAVKRTRRSGVVRVADVTIQTQQKPADSPPATSEKPVNSTAHKPSTRQHKTASPAPQQQPAPSLVKETEATQQEKSQATSEPTPDAAAEADTAGTARKRPTRSSARSTRSKTTVAPPASPSTSAGAAEKPSGTAGDVPERMTINQMRVWLEEHGHGAEVEVLSKNSARRAEWAAVYREKLVAAEAK